MEAKIEALLSQAEKEQEDVNRIKEEPAAESEGRIRDEPPKPDDVAR